jgi:hypothetical protein
MATVATALSTKQDGYFELRGELNLVFLLYSNQY